MKCLRLTHSTLFMLNETLSLLPSSSTLCIWHKALTAISVAFCSSKSSNFTKPIVLTLTSVGVDEGDDELPLVVLDGVPVTDPFFGHVPFSALPWERLDRVTLIRGGGVGAVGQRLLGVVV